MTFHSLSRLRVCFLRPVGAMDDYKQILYSIAANIRRKCYSATAYTVVLMLLMYH